MEFISWNVNGIRAAVRKGFLDFVAEVDPDVMCLQEVRAEPDQVNLPLPQYHIYWNSAEKKGYSGVATFTKKKPLNATYDMGIEKHDREGRMVTLEYKNYFLVNVYTPNAQRGLARLDYRTQEWDEDFLAYVKGLEKSKPVIFCGDLNVAHKEIDLANPKSNERNAGFTVEERRGFDAIVESGFIDTFREFTQEGGHYTWWSNFGRAREKNVGWRIDYFCISQGLRKKLKEATILPHVQSSDHCPIRIVLK